MAAGADRAVNMALRVRGIGEVERDFKKVGDAGERQFERVEKAANGANREVSEYTARLRRVTAEAKAAFDRIPEVQVARQLEPQGYRDAKNRFVLDAVNAEKQLMAQGLPESTRAYEQLNAATDASSASLGRAAIAAAAAGLAFEGARRFIMASAEAWIEHEKAVNAFHAELRLAGNESAVTARQIERMASDIARAYNLSEEGALDAAAALASIPGITEASLQHALDSAAAFAQATGQELPDIIESRTLPVLQALANRDLKALYDATDGLNAPLRAAILSMAEAGNTAGAQQALFEGLARAAGDSDDGLSGVVGRLTQIWENAKLSFAEEFAPGLIATLNGIADGLDWVGEKTDMTAGKWLRMTSILASPLQLPFGLMGGGGATLDENNHPVNRALDIAARARAMAENAQANATVASFGRRYGGSAGGGGRRSTSGRRGGSGSGNAQGDRLAREAESARDAADRVAEANDKVIASYRQRAEEAEDKIGLEGAALEAVERRHKIEAALRRINREEIDKEVAARRAEAAAAGQQFDQARAIEEATAAVDAKSEALRAMAEREADAAEELAKHTRLQREASAILEQIRTPLEGVHDEVERAIELYKNGYLEADEFNRRMDQMAERLGDVRYATNEAAQAWAGFGRDVGETLADFVLDGGSAIDVLERLLHMAASRVLEQTLVNPVADWIDGLTGNNRDKNTAAARAELPSASDFGSVALGASADSAALSLNQVSGSGMAAAQALASVSGTLGNPVEALAMQSDAAASGLGDLVPVTGQLHGALGQLINWLASAGGGTGGGLLGGVLGAVGSLLGGGGGGPNSSLVGSVTAAMDSNPGLFASGTDSLPVGRPFWVGENGRELMQYHGGGRLSVMSNQQVRGGAGGGNYFDLRGAVMTEDLLRQMNEISRGHARDAISGYDDALPDRISDQLARRGG